MPGTALLVATCSATGFALSTSLQHVAAGNTPHTTQGTHRLLAHLARRPWWVLGQVIAVVAFALHALALHLGTLVVVQPVVVSGIVLAVPLRAALERRLPSRSELGTVSLTAAGLALFLLAAQPTAGHAPTSLWLSGALTVLGGAAAVVAAWGASRCRTGERAALWFGVASGVLFGLVASLVKLTTTLSGAAAGSGSHPFAFLGLWSTWAVLVTGLSGVALNQRAYRAARLSASMPVLNIVDVAVAVAFGVAVFGEVPAHSPLAVLGQVVALTCVAVGLRRLSGTDVFATVRDQSDEPRSQETTVPVSPVRSEPTHSSRSIT